MIYKISVGSHSGQVALYELRQGRCQLLTAHQAPVSACAFSIDGKYLVTYSCNENRLSFWQTTTGKYFIQSTKRFVM